ncbi:MAG: hypothetical protein ACO21Q_08940 [Burkholderiaceae bacterium]
MPKWQMQAKQDTVARQSAVPPLELQLGALPQPFLPTRKRLKVPGGGLSQGQAGLVARGSPEGQTDVTPRLPLLLEGQLEKSVLSEYGL